MLTIGAVTKGLLKTRGTDMCGLCSPLIRVCLKLSAGILVISGGALRMMTAAAAREWWATLRRPQLPQAAAGDADSLGSSARLALFGPLLLAGAMFLSAVIGFAVTQVSEARLEAAQHASLQRAVDEFHAEFGDLDAPDDVQMRRIARRAGLGDLRFDADPAGESGRQVQSLHDPRGRIVGWFSWDAGDALAGATDGLWAALAAIALVLAMCGLFALRVSQRLVLSLDRSAETVRKLHNQDVLTGLPNHRAMLEKLNEAVGKLHSGVVVFARIDLDGLREVNDALGRAGGDAVLTNIAEHLQAGLPAEAVLGRFEEDEFAAIMPGGNAHAAAELGNALRSALLRPIFVDRMWQITAGIGLAQAPEDGDDRRGSGAARRPCVARRQARGPRAHARVFEPQIETDYAERRFLLRELQSAIALQAFDVHYQPIVAADGGAMVGVEALAALDASDPRRHPASRSSFRSPSKAG